MDLIAIAQQTGDVSPEAYQRLALRGNLTPPQMAGVEELLQRLAAAEAAANPFANGGGGGGAPEASPSGGGGGYAQFRPPAVIPPSMASPARSQVCRHLILLLDNCVQKRAIVATLGESSCGQVSCEAT